MRRGWFYDSFRHSLAAKGIKTNKVYFKTAKEVVAEKKAAQMIRAKASVVAQEIASNRDYKDAYKELAILDAQLKADVDYDEDVLSALKSNRSEVLSKIRAYEDAIQLLPIDRVERANFAKLQAEAKKEADEEIAKNVEDIEAGEYSGEYRRVTTKIAGKRVNVNPGSEKSDLIETKYGPIPRGLYNKLNELERDISKESEGLSQKINSTDPKVIDSVINKRIAAFARDYANVAKKYKNTLAREDVPNELLYGFVTAPAVDAFKEFEFTDSAGRTWTPDENNVETFKKELNKKAQIRAGTVTRSLAPLTAKVFRSDVNKNLENVVPPTAEQKGESKTTEESKPTEKPQSKPEEEPKKSRKRPYTIAARSSEYDKSQVGPPDKSVDLSKSTDTLEQLRAKEKEENRVLKRFTVPFNRKLEKEPTEITIKRNW